MDGWVRHKSRISLRWKEWSCGSRLCSPKLKNPTTKNLVNGSTRADQISNMHDGDGGATDESSNNKGNNSWCWWEQQPHVPPKKRLGNNNSNNHHYQTTRTTAATPRAFEPTLLLASTFAVSSLRSRRVGSKKRASSCFVSSCRQPRQFVVPVGSIDPIPFPPIPTCWDIANGTRAAPPSRRRPSNKTSNQSWT